MSKFDEQKHNSVWPPSVNRPKIQKRPEEKDSWFSLKSLALLFAGLLGGFVFCAIAETVVFVIFVKIQGAQMLDGASHSNWSATFYAGRIVEVLILVTPVIMYAWLRRHYLFFATGLLIGDCLITVILLRLFFAET